MNAIGNFREKQCSCPVSKYYPSILLEGMRKIMSDLSEKTEQLITGQYLNPEFPD
jgi:hypothetical protein